MTKIDIISGFLGAGKTTLIKKLLGEALAGQQIVLIENEFGEIGIDGGFLKDSGIEISEMNSGCICCSLVGDFGTALKEVLEKFSPDRILIEPSGVGKLSDVIKAVQNVAKDLPMELNSFVTVADAGKCRLYIKNFGEFYNNQIESANAIILSRTQNISQEKLEASVALLREHNSNAAIITTPWDQLTGQQILTAMEAGGAMVHQLIEDDDDDEECCCHHHDHGDSEQEHHHHNHDEDEHEHHHHDHDEDEHEHHHHEHDGDEHEHHHHDHDHHHHHDADEVFSSWGIETPKKFTVSGIRSALDALDSGEYGDILRAKGIVQSEDGSWIHFDFTPGEQNIRTGSADYTGRLCVIGAQLKEDKLPGLFGI